MRQRAAACGSHLRPPRGRAIIWVLPETLPAPHPEDTAPALRRRRGLACPKCRALFEESATAPRACPHDGTQLVRAADLADAADDPMVGRTLDGRFTLLARIGSGSMGAVYRATQSPMGREVAVKILRSDRALDATVKARFLREARANSALVSAHTVTVFDFGESESGELFLAMELLDGESVGQRLAREKTLPLAAAIEVARHTLLSLGEAHAKGIVHRDLKPDNLFFAKVANAKGQSHEVVKVLDFGIAKMLGENVEMNAVETQAGTVFGTPRYMSPEQAQAKPLDGRTDLYSLGVILYHMLTGRPPFTDDDAIIVMARHIKSTPKPFAEVAPGSHLPDELERLVMRALSKDPAARPESAAVMLVELNTAAESSGAGNSGVRSSISPAPSIHPQRAATDESLANAAIGVPSKLTARVLFVAAAIIVGGLATAAYALWPARPVAPVGAPVAAPAAPTRPPEARLAPPPATEVIELSPAPSVAPALSARPLPAAPPPAAPKPSASVAPPTSGRYGNLEP